MVIWLNSEFLKYYIETELYLQNSPMNMKKFIDFCKKRGIKIDDKKLEELEEKKLFYPIFRVTNIYNPISEQYVSPSFDEYSHEELLGYLENGNIYTPEDKWFCKFKEFYDSETHSLKTYSYYSAFQIWPLIEILSDERILEYKQYYFENFVNLLIAIQIYSPYGRSNLRTINLKTEIDVFYKKLEEFDLDEALEVINLGHDELYKSYCVVCRKLRDLLGSDDIIQLWKNIAWSKKDKCIGHTRLGIEYLQWAMMLKRCIEDDLAHETFDVDEVDGNWEKVRDKLPSNETGRTQRGVRNNWYTNKLNDEYEFRLNRKKLYYLANSLTLDYHPRVIIFVEGDTEEIMIPKFFELYGYNFRDLGFEIVNIGGIANFNGTKLTFQNENKKYVKKVISNFKHLVNFNFDLWQAIPFFIGDNENSIIENLKEGVIFDTKKLISGFDNRPAKEVIPELIDEYGEINESLIETWTHIWKYDFELDNFTSLELKNAINEVCSTDFSLNDIQEILDSCKGGKKIGIKSLGDEVEENKISINLKAFDNLVKYYDDTKDSEIFKKSIFKVIERLLDINATNHQPIDTQHALRNREELNKSILLGRDIFLRD